MTKISFGVKIGLATALFCVAKATNDLLDNSPTESLICPGKCLVCSSAEMVCPGTNITEVLNYGIELQILQNIDFSNTSLNFLPVEVQLMLDCKKLNLSANNIRTIDNYMLNNLWSLEELILSNNSISDIAAIHPSVLFYNNKNIEILNMSNNPLTSLGRSPDTILFSESLQVLDVSSCRISSLVGPLVLSGLKNLKYLNLSNNPLLRLDGLISSTLNVLNINGCQLDYLSDGALEGFQNLEILDASLNDQLNIKNTVHSSTLKSLDLSLCSVRTPNMLGMTELRSAFFNGNQIRKLTNYQFVNNTKLITLDLSKNDVESIDSLAFYGMESLLYLDLSSNMIVDVSWEMSIVVLSSLKILNLSHNFIQQIKSLRSNTLRRLDLSFCGIQSIPNDAFVQLDLLAELVLSNNPLQTLLPGSLNLTQLSLLDLSYCRISHLISYEFVNTPNLTDIRLTGNRLVKLKNSTFARCPKLKYVYLDDNPWRCDCHSHDFAYMASLANRTIKNSIIDRTPRCLSPDNVTGMQLHAACASSMTYGRDNRKNFSMAVGVILILCVSGLMAICVAVHENMKSQQAVRRRQQMDEYDGGLGGLGGGGGGGGGGGDDDDAYFDVAESVRKMSQLPSYDEAISLPRPPGKSKRNKRHSCTQTDEAAIASAVDERGLLPKGRAQNGGGQGPDSRYLMPPGLHVTQL